MMKELLLLVLFVLCSTTVITKVESKKTFLSQVINSLHELDVIKTKILNDVEDLKHDIVVNSKEEFGDKNQAHSFSKSDEWHCLPQENSFNLLKTGMSLFKTVNFNVTADNWEDGQGYISFDVSKDRNGLCGLWNSYHPVLPKISLERQSIEWIYLTERPISIKQTVENLLAFIPILHPSFISKASSFFGMCADCEQNDDGGSCGYTAEQCNTYWVTSKSKKCPSNGEILPTNVGSLRCISDDVQGDQGWCSLRIGPWHNVCVRVRSVEDLPFNAESTEEKTKYNMNIYTQYDLSYIQNFMVGASLVANARFVASWRVAHYVIGFAFGAFAAVVVLIRSVFKSTQEAMMPSPLRSLASLTPMLTFAFVGPLWNNLVMPALVQVLHLYFCTRRSCLVYEVRTASEFYMSWFTKLAITISGFIGMYLVSYFKIFKTIIAEDPELDEYGREHIVESRPASQVLLCTVMEYAGYGILCHCTSNGVVSSIVIGILFFRNFIEYRAKLWCLWCYSRSPASFRELLNEQEYEELGENYTNDAMKKHREYLQSPEGKKEMGRVKEYEMTQRFANGGSHIDEDVEMDDEGSSWCNIM
jgi:hypothetical protein